MLVLVPIAAPVHATNNSPLVYTVGGEKGYNPILAGDEFPVELNITNPATNQYAITEVTAAVPNSNWIIEDCATYSPYLDDCTGTSSSIDFFGGVNLPPGTTATVVIWMVPPDPSASLIYPYTGSWTTTVQDQSSAAFYTGPKFSVQVIADSSSLSETVTPGGSNTQTTYTAGTAPYTISAQLTCSTSEPGCTTGYENGVVVSFGESEYGDNAVYSFTHTSVVTSGGGSSAGSASTTFQPSNIASTQPGIGFTQVYSGVADCGLTYSCFTLGPEYSSDISTIPAAPSSVGFTSGGDAFGPGTTIYLTNSGSTTNSTVYTGAQLCNTLNSGCTADAQQVAVSVTDRFGNPIAFTDITTPKITFQTASGAVFDAEGVPSTISNFVPTASPQPVPDNYYQASPFGSAGVITATITGTYNSGTFSVSGSSGSILTGTFSNSTTASFQNTDHVTFPVTTVQAGKSVKFEVNLGVAQSNVPVTVAVCDHGSCSETTSGYNGVIASASGVTNSSGIYSTSLAVDTKATTVAVLNATVAAPETGAPHDTYNVAPSNNITTTAGPAAKFTVIVGVGSMLDPSPITSSIAGQTVYVNVVTSDAYGNPVSTVGSEEVGITLTANPATLTDNTPAIPTNCYETNGTSGNGCSTGFGSFGPIAWTLPSTAPSTATIFATGVLGGVSITSATVTITIVSKLPSLSVTSPLPLAGVIYSDSENTQFRGWANVSAGYNGLVNMKSLGWKIGTSSWQTTGLAAVQDATWSIVPTLNVGLNTIEFNASDADSNVVVSSPYTVLVDTQAPVVTAVTANNATLSPGQLFQGSIVVDQGDLNATSVTVSVNGTAISSSDITVTGTNDLGSSVTYTVTAVLPTGDNSVTLSASSLAGLTGNSGSEIVHVSVAQGDSIVFTQGAATYGTVGAYTGITVPVTNLWPSAQNVVIFATLKSGTSIYVAEGTTTLSPGQTASVFTIDLQNVPAGTYSVTFAAVSTSNVPVSAPTTPVTITVS